MKLKLSEENAQSSLVAFIDILGFKAMVEDYYEGGDKDTLLILRMALDKASSSTNESINIFEGTNIDVQYKQFSDCVSLSMRFLDDSLFLPQIITFIDIVRRYQKTLMENGIFCRGGIAYDYHYENENFIFSKSLIKAYEIESTIAIFPRIVIDAELIKKIKTEMAFLKLQAMNDFLGAIIIKDWDDIYFLNPLDYQWYMLLLPTSEGLDEAKLNVRKEFLHNHSITYDRISEYVKIYIDRFKDDYGKQRKYVWLRDFLIWHNNPSASKIAFGRLTL